MSHETDILIVGYSQERFTVEIRRAFRHWQVYSVANPMAIEGRHFRRAYYTEGAVEHPRWEMVNATLVANAVRSGGEVLPFEQYEEPTVDLVSWEDQVLVSNLRRARYTDS